jgi:hypothetical protein
MSILKEHITDLRHHYPSIGEDWLESMRVYGKFCRANRSEKLISKGDPAKCFFILKGLAIGVSDEKVQLYSPGSLIGLTETFFSANIPGSEGVVNKKKGGDKRDLLFTPIRFTCDVHVMNEEFDYICIDSRDIVNTISKNPRLHETWLYLLNQSFEKEMFKGIVSFNQNTLERLKETLFVIRQHSDEEVRIPVKYLQSLTGISRSSMYRCINELQKKERMIVCENGKISFS